MLVRRAGPALQSRLAGRGPHARHGVRGDAQRPSYIRSKKPVVLQEKMKKEEKILDATTRFRYWTGRAVERGFPSRPRFGPEGASEPVSCAPRSVGESVCRSPQCEPHRVEGRAFLRPTPRGQGAGRPRVLNSPSRSGSGVFPIGFRYVQV